MKKTEQHPITPPHILRGQWQSESPFKVTSVEREDYMINRAAQWGADQELEACCKWLEDQLGMPENCRAYVISKLRAARRPKPPSLKEKALKSLERIENNEATYLDAANIFDALNTLPDD
jgi:hypothetical protein